MRIRPLLRRRRAQSFRFHQRSIASYWIAWRKVLQTGRNRRASCLAGWPKSTVPDPGAKTALAKLTLETYEPVLTFPSGGDTSYPGFVWHEGLLWMSYYSSHEGKTSIYLAKVKLK